MNGKTEQIKYDFPGKRVSIKILDSELDDNRKVKIREYPIPRPLSAFLSDKPNSFIPHRIVFDFELKDSSIDKNPDFNVDVEFIIGLTQKDIDFEKTGGSLQVANWIDGEWEVLTQTDRREIDSDFVALTGSDIVEIITVTGSLRGDPPIAVGR